MSQIHLFNVGGLQASSFRRLVLSLFATAACLVSVVSASAQGSDYPPSLDPNQDGIPGVQLVQHQINLAVSGQRDENRGTDNISSSQKAGLKAAHAVMGGTTGSGAEPPPNSQTLVSNASPEVLRDAVMAAIQENPELAVQIVQDLIRFFGRDFLKDRIQAILVGAVLGSPNRAGAIRAAIIAFYGDGLTPEISKLLDDAIIGATNLTNVPFNLNAEPFGPGTTEGNTIPEDNDEDPVTPVTPL